MPKAAARGPAQGRRALKAAHGQDRLQFFGPYTELADKAAFKTFLEPLYHTHWHVYAKSPCAGPQQVLAYLARYTHRVAISNSRLIKADQIGVRFRYKDYRIKGPGRYKTMTLAPGEFIRRFMLHVLPNGFHRIRHYGLLASCRTKAATLARARERPYEAHFARERRGARPPNWATRGATCGGSRTATAVEDMLAQVITPSAMVSSRVFLVRWPYRDARRRAPSR